jgi:hypothetical protein
VHKLIKENLFKNLVLVLFLFLSFFTVKAFLENSVLSKELSLAGDVLVAVSIVAVLACFGNFAFSYEKINVKNSFQRFLAHLTTGLFMFVIGLSLIFTQVLVSFIMGSFFVIDVVLILVYAANISYDFLDLYKLI